jgi:hypothetical protein
MALTIASGYIRNAVLPKCLLRPERDHAIIATSSEHSTLGRSCQGQSEDFAIGSVPCSHIGEVVVEFLGSSAGLLAETGHSHLDETLTCTAEDAILVDEDLTDVAMTNIQLVD